MKAVLLIVISLLYFSSNTKAQEEWTEFKSSMSGSFRYVHNFNNNIVLTSINSDYIVIDYESKEVIKSGKFFEGSVVCEIKVIDDLLYITSLNNNFSDAKVNIFNENYELVNSYNLSNIIGAATNIHKINNNFYFGLTEYPSNSAMILSSGDDFSEFKSSYIFENNSNMMVMYDMEYFNNKIYTVYHNGYLLVSSDYGESWNNKNAFKELYHTIPRQLIVNDMCIMVISDDGYNAVSFDDGDNFIENELLPIYDFKPYGTIVFDNNSILVSGYSKSTNKGYVLLTKDFGETWEISLETDKQIYSLIQVQDKLICQQIDGKLYSINANVISSVESNNIKQSKRVLTTGKLDYQKSFQNTLEILDINGNIIENDIYNVYDNYIDVEGLSKGFYILKEENNYLQFIKY